MPAVLVSVPTVMLKLLHHLSTSFIITHHLLDFMVQGKMTEEDTPTVRLDATPSGLWTAGAPTSIIPPFLLNHPNLSWLGTGTE